MCFSIVEIRIVDVLAVLVTNHALVVKKGFQALYLVVGIRMSTGGISAFEGSLAVSASFYRTVGEYHAQCLAVLFLGQLVVGIGVFGFPARLGKYISTGNLRQSIVIDTKGEWVELGGADHGGADLRNSVIGLASAHLKDGLSLVVQLGADMTTRIVIAFVEVQDRMDMYLILISPFHQLADKVCRFFGAVDVIHQVAHTVDDYKSYTGSVDYRLFDNFKAQGWCELTQSGELQMFRMSVGRQFRQSQGTIHYLLAMIRALLGIEVEDCALVVGKLGCVAQYFAVDERCPDDGSDIEGLFALCLTGRCREVAESAYDTTVGNSTSGAV